MDDILVKISAQIDELKSGFDQAKSIIGGTLNEVKDKFTEVQESAENFHSSLQNVLAGGEFLIFKEIAETALHAVESAFDSTVEKAFKFALSNAKLAAQMGITQAEAVGLSEQLKILGISSDNYAQMASRVAEKIRTQESAVNAMGVATRDANGNLLNTQQIMENGINVLRNTKAGTDQLVISTELFGLRSRQLFDLMRLNPELNEKLAETYKSVGASIDGSNDSIAVQYEETARLHTLWDAFQIAIGQRVMPQVTAFFTYLADHGAPVLNAVRIALEALITVIDLVVTGFAEVGTVISTVTKTIVHQLIEFGKIAKDVFTLDWDAVKRDWKEGTDAISNDVMGGIHKLVSQGKDEIDRLNNLWNGPQGNGQNPYAGGSNRAPMTEEEARARQARIDGEMAAAVESIKIEEQKNQTLLSLGQITADEEQRRATELENKKYQIQANGLRERIKLDIYHADEKEKDLQKLALLEQQHQLNLLKIDAAGDKARQALNEQAVHDYISANQQQLQADIAHEEARLKLGEVTENQAYEYERDLTEKIYREDIQRLQDLENTLTPGTQAWAKADAERLKLETEMRNKLQQMNDKYREEERKKWDQLGKSIQSSFNSALNGMLTGTKSWQQALGSVLDSIVNGFATMAEESAEKWIVQQARAFTQGKELSLASAFSQITSAAATAASNTYAAVSAIPIVGPFLAPEAAAAAYAGTIAFKSLASAAGGMVVDQDQVAAIHKNEMVLPANISQGLLGMIKNGNPSSGDVHLHYQPTINAPGQSTLESMLTKEAGTMRDWLRKQQRNGALKLRAA